MVKSARQKRPWPAESSQKTSSAAASPPLTTTVSRANRPALAMVALASAAWVHCEHRSAAGRRQTYGGALFPGPPLPSALQSSHEPSRHLRPYHGGSTMNSLRGLLGLAALA